MACTYMLFPQCSSLSKQGNRRSSESKDIQYFNGTAKRFFMGQQRQKTRCFDVPSSWVLLNLGVNVSFFGSILRLFSRITPKSAKKPFLGCQTPPATPAPLGVSAPALPSLSRQDWLACLLQRRPSLSVRLLYVLTFSLDNV